MRNYLLAAVALWLVACGSADRLAAPTEMRIEVGRPFPNLILPGLDDSRPASIAQFRGKKILLHVFASW